MIAIVGLYLALVLYALVILRKVVRTSAGFVWIARRKGLVFGTVRDGGFVVTNVIPFPAQRRIRNALAAIAWPVLTTTVLTLTLYWLASLMAMVV